MKPLESELLFADEHILVVNKPSGITVIPDRTGTKNVALIDRLEPLHGKLWVVHRIDRGTSGVVVFARSAAAHRALNQQFENHTVRKQYTAVASGWFAKPQQTISSPIAAHPSGNGSMVVHPKGKAAVTHLSVVKQFRSAALLQIEIETGRTHQIRVHLQSIGHPLLVDEMYGGGSEFRLSQIKRGYKTAGDERSLIARLTLHAAAIQFSHPVSEDRLKVEAPLPKDLRVLIDVMQKYDC